MNKIKKIVCLFLAFSLFATVFAQENTQEVQSENTQGQQQKKKIGFRDGRQPYFIFDYGLCFTQTTHIAKQNDRSDFRFVDTLVGIEGTMRTRNMTPYKVVPVNGVVRLAAFYPLSTGFNDVYTKPVMLLQGGLDLSIGFEFKIDVFDVVKFNIVPVLHGFLQVNDRWTILDLGAGVYINFELPLAYRWTIIGGVLYTIDNGNCGNNRYVEPYDSTSQYQIELAVRYSKKDVNHYNYLHQTSDNVEKWDANEAAKKANKGAQNAARKEAQEAANQAQGNFSDANTPMTPEEKAAQKAAAKAEKEAKAAAAKAEREAKIAAEKAAKAQAQAEAALKAAQEAAEKAKVQAE